MKIPSQSLNLRKHSLVAALALYLFSLLSVVSVKFVMAAPPYPLVCSGSTSSCGRSSWTAAIIEQIPGYIAYSFTWYKGSGPQTRLYYAESGMKISNDCDYVHTIFNNKTVRYNTRSVGLSFPAFTPSQCRTVSYSLNQGSHVAQLTRFGAKASYSTASLVAV